MYNQGNYWAHVAGTFFVSWQIAFFFLYRLGCVYISDAIGWYSRPNWKSAQGPPPPVDRVTYSPLLYFNKLTNLPELSSGTTLLKTWVQCWCLSGGMGVSRRAHHLPLTVSSSSASLLLGSTCKGNV